MEPLLTLQKLGLDIYAYLDSRKLIQDYCQLCKARDSRYSLRWFARKMGFGAPNYIKLIIDGERNISEKRIQAFSDVMGLKGEEQEYFELLVRVIALWSTSVSIFYRATLPTNLPFFSKPAPSLFPQEVKLSTQFFLNHLKWL